MRSRRTRLRVAAAVLIAALGVPFAAPRHGAWADEPPRVEADDALANAYAALAARLRAQLKEAERLEREDRHEEALAAVGEMKRIYHLELRQLALQVARARTEAAQDPTESWAGRRVATQSVASAFAVALASDNEIWWEPRTPAFSHRGERPYEPAGGKRRTIAPHALSWLVAHQSPDGRWEAATFDRWCWQAPAAQDRPDGPGGLDRDLHVSGLALAALLGAGYTHLGDHEFARCILRGLAWLMACQDDEGVIGSLGTPAGLQDHAVATLVLVEACGMTRSPVLRASAQRALDALAQHRAAYFMAHEKVDVGDEPTLATAWAALALHAAREVHAADVAAARAPLLTVPVEALDGVRAWLVAACPVGSQGPAASPGVRTATCVLLRLLFEADRSSAARKEAETRLAPFWSAAALAGGPLDLDACFLAALAAVQIGESSERRARDVLTPLLAQRQRFDGKACAFHGSVDPVGPREADGGRVFSTAILVLCDTAGARYLPQVARR